MICAQKRKGDKEFLMHLTDAKSGQIILNYFLEVFVERPPIIPMG
jgi:hypothetical protein